MSTLKADTIQNTSGGAVTLTKQQAAKSLLNYNHSTDTVNTSFNISSVADDATGLFTVSHINSYSDAFYCPSTVDASRGASARGSATLGVRAEALSSSDVTITNSAYSTSSLELENAANASSTQDAKNTDCDRASLQIFGDLA